MDGFSFLWRCIYESVIYKSSLICVWIHIVFPTKFRDCLLYSEQLFKSLQPKPIATSSQAEKACFPIDCCYSNFCWNYWKRDCSGSWLESTFDFVKYFIFDQADPHFNMDISFYVFVLPFIEFILYTLINLFLFFLVAQIGAYSVFGM